MSDADDGSPADEPGDDEPGFDKEAEREKLREKYERDQERREITQQMSDLLLKGATMTNHHCDECGTPIFRMDGEEFCPTCGGSRAIDEDTAEDTEPSASQPAGHDRPKRDQGIEDRHDGTEQRIRDERSGGKASQPLDSSAGSRQEAGGVGSDSGGPGVSVAPGRRPAHEHAERNRTNPTDQGSREGPRVPHEASVEAAPSMAQARASLRRAIVSLAEQAAQSDDPTRANDLLEAAGEAAEALSELNE